MTDGLMRSEAEIACYSEKIGELLRVYSTSQKI